MEPANPRSDDASGNRSRYRRTTLSLRITSLALPGRYSAVLHPRYFHDFGRTGWKKEYSFASTAWLGALRGLAAFSAYLVHTYFDTTHDTTQYWLDLLFIAGLVNGRAIVQVFFVIAGFAMSSRVLKTLKTQPQRLQVLRLYEP
jgi:hypothetical protein